MTSLLAVSAFVAVAAITPGPNNLIVLAAAARGGMAAALPAIAGVIGGSLALLVAAWAGAGAAFEAVPGLQGALRAAGAAWLAWLGLGLVRAAGRPLGGAGADALPRTALGVAAFQVLNPKGWALVAAAVSATGGAPGGLPALAGTFAAITGACLAAWAAAGQAMARRLARPRAKRAFDAATGALLALSAVLLLLP